jgi:hypothetical protein
MLGVVCIRLRSPIDHMAYMTALQTIDLSYNLLTAESSALDEFGQLKALLGYLPTSVKSLDLSVIIEALSTFCFSPNPPSRALSECFRRPKDPNA